MGRLGFCFQLPTLAAQAYLPEKDASMGIGLIIFGTLLGGAILVAAGDSGRVT